MGVTVSALQSGHSVMQIGSPENNPSETFPDDQCSPQMLSGLRWYANNKVHTTKWIRYRLVNFTTSFFIC